MIKKDKQTLKKLKNPINRNFKYEQSGASKIEIPNLKFNIDVRKVAELAKKRINKGGGLDEFDIEELRERKVRKVGERINRVQAKSIKAEKGEFVLIDGSSYNGYYHIQDDGTVMSEATHIIGKSQALITRNDWVDNREVYLMIAHKLEYENPYRKREVRKLRKRKPKTKRGFGSLGGRGSIRGGGSTGGSGGGSGGGGY